MNKIGQWTTPTVTFTVQGAHFTEAVGVYITFMTRKGLTTFSNAEIIDDDHVSLTFTQEQTGLLIDDQATVQMNITYANKKRVMTTAKRVAVIDNLEDRVL